MNDYKTVRYAVEGRVATITLNRPDVRNALSVAMLKELLAVTERAIADDNVRAVVLAAAGNGFCAGADLRDTSLVESERNVHDHIEEDHKPILMAIANSPKPFISAVNGAAAGAGAAYAMVCDLLIMAEDAYLYQAFLAIGLIPDCGATWHLVHQVGMKRAYELIALGEKLTAQRCLEAGLANRVVPAEALLSTAHGIAQELAEKAPLALRNAKTVITQAPQLSLDAVISLEAKLQRECFESEDFAEGRRAFLEKRKPNFVGR